MQTEIQRVFVVGTGFPDASHPEVRWHSNIELLSYLVVARCRIHFKKPQAEHIDCVMSFRPISTTAVIQGPTNIFHGVPC